jgi:hypothetical protein
MLTEQMAVITPYQLIEPFNPRPCVVARNVQIPRIRREGQAAPATEIYIHARENIEELYYMNTATVRQSIMEVLRAKCA